MTEYVKIVIKNKEPLRIADDSTSQSGQTVTLRYIPGTTMRGYVINKLAAEPDFEQIKGMLFSEQVRYLDAYLCVKGEKSFKGLIPSPKGFYEDKTEVTGKKEMENVVIKGEFTDGKKRASLGKYCYIEDGCVYYYNVSTASDMKIKIAQRGTSDQSVFRNEYIEKNHYFMGFIAVEDHKMAQKIKKIFDQQDLILGNARSSGFGKCEVVKCELTSEIPYKEYLPQKDQKNECYMMLLSNTILRNEMGELCGFTPELVDKLGKQMNVKDLEVAFCSTSTVNVRGYNRTWGTKLPSMTAYQSGSVFHLKFNGTFTCAAMQDIVNKGIGVRLNSGFGRVLFFDNYENVKYKESKKYFEETSLKIKEQISYKPEDQEVLKSVARNYYRNRIKRGLEAYIRKETSGEGRSRSFCDLRTSNSQLGTIDSILTANKYSPEKAKKELDGYLQHENNKADKNSAHKDHNSLKNMEEFVDKSIFGRSLDEIAKFQSKESGKIMGIPVSELFSEEDINKMKMELIVDLIRFKNKEAR